ncbi:MAG: alpha/beta fold hydrolase [Chloroflexota bacterium]
MMTIKFRTFFIFSIILASLVACNTPPESVEPEAQAESAGALEAVDEPTAEVEIVEPTQAPPRDYPSPEVNTESYPAPEAVEENGYPEPEAEAEVEVVAIETPTEELPERETSAGAYSREVVIPMADELGIIATFSGDNSNGRQPGVLLLHMLGGTRNDWKTAGFSDVLNQSGYATLAIDMRGHGESISEVDWALAEQDLIQVWEWFISQPEVEPNRSAVIGASIGSNLALRTAANQPSVQASVLLSPGLNYRDVTTDDVMVNMDRPVLLVAMSEDNYAAESAAELELINVNVSTLAVQPGNAHGTRMFGAYEELEPLIVAFLDSNLK